MIASTRSIMAKASCSTKVADKSVIVELSTNVDCGSDEKRCDWQ